ncbi:signal peptide protein [Ralstonia sp. A12]|uniref:DUF3108 domain-containing protein n=1 Tax=Ralstonia sp. A12 TaxID=1217052 RepID=UPI0005753B76|nr:DUF3108 domain-containing protein [Ralstonia sp. A12]KHK53563.1 signal peptide protein [Ralstonia sp. A12]
MDTLHPLPRNPEDQTATRVRRWRRWGLIALAVLVVHGIAVVWIARSHQMTWPPEPEQIVPTLLLQPEPVKPPVPPAPKAQPKPAPPKPRGAPPQPAPAPAQAAVPAPEDADTPMGAAAGASADTGMIRDLGGEGMEGSAPPAPEARFSPPPSATLHYATYVNGVRNEDGVIRWTTDGKTYTLSVEIPLPLFFGSLAFRSNGAIDTYGLTPARYEEVRGRRQPDVTTFHYAEAAPASGVPGAPTITFTRTPNVLPLPVGTQDRFSVFLQLTGLVRGNPERFTSPGLTLEIPIADTDSVEVARVQHVGEDTIDTPEGTIRAQHFIRLPRREGDQRRVEIWLSAERGWLPVRLRQTEPNGMQFELVYQSEEGG